MLFDTDWPKRLADVKVFHHDAPFNEHNLSFNAYMNHLGLGDESTGGGGGGGGGGGDTNLTEWIPIQPGSNTLILVEKGTSNPVPDLSGKIQTRDANAQDGGSGGAAAPFAGTGEGIRQFDLELAEDIRFHKAQIKQLEDAQKSETGRNRERIAADLSIARDRLAMDLRIQKMDVNTRLKIARKETELGLRGQDITREGNALSAQGDLLQFASQADPFAGAAALVGDPSGTTPFDVGAEQLRAMIAKASAGGVRDVDPFSGLDAVAAQGLPRSSTFNIKVGEKGGDDGDEEIVRVDRATGKLIDIIPIDTGAAKGLTFGLPKGHTAGVAHPHRIDFRASDGLTAHDLSSELGTVTRPPPSIDDLDFGGPLPTGFGETQPDVVPLPGLDPPSFAPGAPVPTPPPGEVNPNPVPPTERTLAQVNADPRRLEYRRFGIDPFAVDAQRQLDAAKREAADRATSEAADTKATDEQFMVRADDGSREVFLVKNGVRFHIPDGRTLKSMGLSFDDVRTISVAEMNSIPQGKTLPSLQARLIKGGLDPATGLSDGKIYIELNGQISHVANTDELRKLVAAGIVPSLDVETVSSETFDSFTNDLQPFLTQQQQGQQTAQRTLESLLGPDRLASGLAGNDFTLNPVFNTALPNPNQLANIPFLFGEGAQDDPRARTLLSAFSRSGNDLPMDVVRRMAAAFRPSTVGRTASVGFG